MKLTGGDQAPICETQFNFLQERTEKKKVIRAHDVYLDGGVRKWLVVLSNHLIGNQL